MSSWYDAQWPGCSIANISFHKTERGLFIVGYLGEKPRPEIFLIREDNKIHDRKQKPTTVRTLTAWGHSRGHHSQMTMILHESDKYEHEKEDTRT